MVESLTVSNHSVVDRDLQLLGGGYLAVLQVLGHGTHFLLRVLSGRAEGRGKV